jgi:hypothetical protein
VFKWETGAKDVFYLGAGETVDAAFPVEVNRCVIRFLLSVSLSLSNDA